MKVDLAKYLNAHVNIDGASGTGKTTLLRKLASQVPKQGGHAVFFDASGDSMLNTLSDIEGFQTIDVRSSSLSYAPPSFRSGPGSERISTLLIRTLRLWASVRRRKSSRI